MIGFIYSLNHPVSQEVIYIGSTTSSLKDRLASHLRESRNGLCDLYRYLRTEKIVPKITLIERVSLSSIRVLLNKEKDCIKAALRAGKSLLNYYHNDSKRKTKKYSLIKIPEAVHSLLKVHCAKTGKPMWFVAASGIEKEVYDREKAIKSKSKKK